MPILGSLLAALFEDAVPTLAINPTVTISSSSDQATDPITGAQQSNSVQTMISVDSRQVQEASASNSSLVEFDNTPNHGSGLSLFDPVLSLFDPGELPSNWLKSILSNQNQSVELPLTTYPITGAQQSNSVQTMISVDSQQVLEASASNSSLVVFDDSAPLNSIPFDDAPHHGSGVGLGLLFDPVLILFDPGELPSNWLESIFSNQNQSVELPLTTDPFAGV